MKKQLRKLSDDLVKEYNKQIGSGENDFSKVWKKAIKLISFIEKNE